MALMFSLEAQKAFITGAMVMIADLKDASSAAQEIGAEFVYVDVSSEQSVKDAMAAGHAVHP